MNPKNVWRWISNHVTRKRRTSTIISFDRFWSSSEHWAIWNTHKKYILNYRNWIWPELFVWLIIMIDVRSILTANIECFTLFTLADCIVNLTLNHSIVVFSCNIWNYLQMNIQNENENGNIFWDILKSKCTIQCSAMGYLSMGYLECVMQNSAQLKLNCHQFERILW